MANAFAKDPHAVLDYSWDWTAWLAASETISTATVTVAGSVVVDSTVLASPVVTAWVSGGTAGDTDSLTCRITTSDGRTDDRTIRLSIRER